MYFRKKIFGIRIVFYWRRVIPIIGVNSTLKDSKHVPMLEYDGMNFRELLTEVRELQSKYRLGSCTIASTGRADSWHVYFMTRLSWRDCIKLYASTELSDLKHLYFSMKRNHFTLRLTPKGKRKIELMDIIESQYKDDVRLEELKSFVLYETAVRL